MTELWYGLLDLLLPRRCIVCDSIVPSRTRPVPLCDDDWSSVRPVEPASCRFCARPMSADGDPGVGETSTYPRRPICGACRTTDLVLEFLAAGFRFESVLRDAVSDWKFDGNPEWGPWLGTKLAGRVMGVFNPTRWDYVTPVPMYYRRREERGFNQAKQLAEALAAEWDVTFRSALSKHRRTDPQSSLGREERMRNLTDAFSLEGPPDSLRDKRVLLVDDIYTTGSTLRTAAGVLKEAGADVVAGVVLARTPPESS